MLHVLSDGSRTKLVTTPKKLKEYLKHFRFLLAGYIREATKLKKNNISKLGHSPHKRRLNVTYVWASRSLAVCLHDIVSICIIFELLVRLRYSKCFYVGTYFTVTVNATVVGSILTQVNEIFPFSHSGHNTKRVTAVPVLKLQSLKDMAVRRNWMSKQWIPSAYLALRYTAASK